MPTMHMGPTLAQRIARRKAAQAKVRAKFPALIEGSNGWNRALSAYLK